MSKLVLTSSTLTSTLRFTSPSSTLRTAAPVLSNLNSISTGTDKINVCETYTFPNDTCYVPDNDVVKSLLPFLQLNPGSDDCPTAEDILLWFSIYNVVTVLFGLIFGANHVRAHLRISHQLPFRIFRPLQILGSLAFHVAATVGMASLLVQDAAFHASLTYTVLLWFARPLATPIIAWLNMLNPRDYTGHSREVCMVDTLYGFVSIYAFGTVARVTNWRTLPGTYGLAFARAGSAVGILALLFLMLFMGLMVWLDEAVTSGDDERMPYQMLTVAFFLHSLRFLACWLLWWGLLSANSTAFCPSQTVLVKIMAVWLGVTCVDNIWRAVFSPAPMDEDDDEDEEVVRQLL